MKQLTGMDASFLYMDTPALHMHTIKVGILDPSGVPGGYSFEKFRTGLAARLHRLPPFRLRAIEIPYGLGHPVWIEDPDFDLEQHISQCTAPAPGGDRELCQVISEFAGKPLDRSRPLWEILAVDGLEGGRVASVAKIHHSLADGVAAFELLMNVFRDDSEEAAETAAAVWKPDQMPTRKELIRLALVAMKRNLLSLPRLVWRTLCGLVAVTRHALSSSVHAPIPFQVPIANFNRALTPNRTLAFARLSLNDVKTVKRRVGVTVNDVLLAVCSGALRGYLGERGELSDRSMSVGVPINTRPDKTGRLVGNHVGNLVTTLRTDLADPIERLRDIHEVTKDAKRRQEVLGTDMLESWGEFAPPSAYSSIQRAVHQYRIADYMPPPINLIISNVAGPREPMELGGAHLVALHSVGPILEGIGLNITAWSYLDTLYVTILSCPENLPDVWKLADWIPRGLEELLEATEGMPESGSASKPN
jgi:diacylglycerol O-acyltransferase